MYKQVREKIDDWQDGYSIPLLFLGIGLSIHDRVKPVLRRLMLWRNDEDL